LAQKPLWLRGRGLPSKMDKGFGDILIHLHITFPPTLDQETVAQLRHIAGGHSFNPRRGCPHDEFR
jgi:DnaJ-class molecular chaperone